MGVKHVNLDFHVVWLMILVFLRYLVAQSLYKLVPAFDAAVLGILSRDPGRFQAVPDIFGETQPFDQGFGYEIVVSQRIYNHV